jgi:hypothetical protein
MNQKEYEHLLEEQNREAVTLDKSFTIPTKDSRNMSNPKITKFLEEKSVNAENFREFIEFEMVERVIED